MDRFKENIRCFMCMDSFEETFVTDLMFDVVLRKYVMPGTSVKSFFKNYFILLKQWGLL